MNEIILLYIVWIFVCFTTLAAELEPSRGVKNDLRKWLCVNIDLYTELERVINGVLGSEMK